jgi:2-amino-4-hydroxy-6-hydroxymethyldihydropteridine diphosphokinase
MTTVFLSLGSNKGKRKYYLEKMVDMLSSVMEPNIRRSRVMETEPLGMHGCSRWFFNLVVRADFTGTPAELLLDCNRIERALGRRREKLLCARTADIDILLFGRSVIRERSLIVPHPRLLERRFCLEGLRQVGPSWKIPGTGITVKGHCDRMPPHVRSQRIIFISGNANGNGNGRRQERAR